MDAAYVGHGFLLDKNGAVHIFDAPDAGNVPGSFQGTYPWESMRVETSQDSTLTGQM